MYAFWAFLGVSSTPGKKLFLQKQTISNLCKMYGCFHWSNNSDHCFFVEFQIKFSIKCNFLCYYVCRLVYPKNQNQRVYQFQTIDNRIFRWLRICNNNLFVRGIHNIKIRFVIYSKKARSSGFRSLTKSISGTR